MKGCISALLFILLTAFVSCSGDQAVSVQQGILGRNNQTTNKKDTLVFRRFEQDLFRVNANSFTTDTARLHATYGSFMNLYFNRIIRLGSIESAMFQQNLMGFLQDPDIRSVYQAIEVQYKDLNPEKKQIEAAFDRYSELFPDSLIPHVYTMLSGFSYNIVSSDSAMGIGLDMYLGADSRFYELLAYPKYKASQMCRDRIVIDAIRAYLLSSWEMEDPYRDLITRMIYHGRILYLASKLLPEESEARIIGYTDQEMNWCKENEAKIWSHFIDRKLFYSTDFNDEVVYINDGPFTKGFTQDAPARLGVWLGLQLVKSYMEKEGGDIQNLMREKDARKIFSNSKYKPGRG